MKLPSFSDLIPEQLAVYERAPDDSILVVGPPGSGKTSMAIWRARLLTGPGFQRRVALVTRNRLLACVAGQLAKDNDGANICTTTMDSLIRRDYYHHFRHGIPKEKRFDYKWDDILDEYKAAAPEPAYDHMIIDEGQNLPRQFFHWAVRFGGRAVSVFADEDQTTLGTGTRIADLQDAGFNSVLPLLVNHRNTEEIVDVIDHFHTDRVVPRGMPSRGRCGELPCMMAVNSWNALADAVAARWTNRRETIGVIVYRKHDVHTVAGLLRKRLSTARVDAYTSDLRKGAEQAIHMREDGITILSSESAIGLEFDTLYLQDLWRNLPVEQAIQRRRLYMLCARARDNLILVNGPKALTAPQLTSLPPTTTLVR